MANEFNFRIKEQAGLGFKELSTIKQFISEHELLVGIPEAEPSNKRKMVAGTVAPTNAELLHIHTNGSKPNNIPARPVIEPAISNGRDKISSSMDSIIKSIRGSDQSEAIVKLQKLGLRVQNMCRAWFTNPLNGWEPNSQATIERKLRKGSTNPRPLIDTNQLRKSITYVIKTKGGMVK